MWDHYRRTFIPAQILILAICIVLVVFWHMPLRVLCVYFLVMEFFSFVGVLWALRLKRKIQRSRGLLR